MNKMKVNIETNRKTDNHTNGQLDIWTNRQRKINKQTYRQMKNGI